MRGRADQSDPGRLGPVPELPEVESLADVPASHRDRPARGTRRARRDQRAEDLRPARATDLVGARVDRRRTARQVPRHQPRRRGRRAAAPRHPPRARGLAALAPGDVVGAAQAGQGTDRAARGVRRRRRRGGRRLRPHRGRHAQAARGVRRRATRRASRASRGSGPEPLDDAFTVDVLAAILADAGGKQLKGVLRDQSTIAGIGNAYSDDILHAAKLSPYKAAGKLTPERDRHAAPGHPRPAHRRRRALAGARGRRPQGREEARACACTDAPVSRARCAATSCARCRFADSSLQYCATCQTDGKPLADRRFSKFLK